MSGALRGNCCEPCRSIPQKTPMDEFTKKNALTTDAFLERLQLFLINKKSI